MIRNKLCAYCGRKMNTIENDPLGRTVEHLIPNASTTVKRNKGEGDFYACSECNNGKKSKVDNIISKIALLQCSDEDLALETAYKEINKNSHFYQQIKKNIMKSYDRSGRIKIPLKGRELIDYMVFLGKGEYLKTTNEIYDSDKYVMVLNWYNKEVLQEVEKNYSNHFQSNPFKDLMKNPNVELINNGECIIYKQGLSFGFFLHNYIVISIQILRKSKRNYKKARSSEIKILKEFK